MLRKQFEDVLAEFGEIVKSPLAHMMDEDHAAKTAEIYARAQVAAAGGPELQSRLQEAWQAVNTLPADATPDAKVDAAHRLLVEIVRAFRAA